MAYSSNLPAIRAKMEAATDAGLIAAAEVVKNRVKEDLAGGYTSGAFVTGHVLNSVTRSEPEQDGQGAFILIGTNVSYALFWEIGFVPARGVFSPGIGRHTQGPIQMQRVEIWMPALLNTRAEQLAAFQRVYARFMAQ